MISLIFGSIAFIMLVHSNSSDDPTKWIEIIERLRPLHKKLGKPGPHDWLAHHHEPGQTFNQYVQSDPVTPDEKHCMIYIQPVGEFTELQRRIVTLTSDFMIRFYNLRVHIQKDIPLSAIPSKAKRVHPECGMCGSNHREEADRRPLWFCPECMAKVCWAKGTDPVSRYQTLADFCDKNGLVKEKAFYEKSIKVLGKGLLK